MTNKFWNTATKRMTAMVSLGIAGYYALIQAFPDLPTLPAFVTNPWFGQISLLTIAGALVLFSVWMMFDNQLNG